jgi:hypothetical protein
MPATKITVKAVAEAAIAMAGTYPFPSELRPELARQVERIMTPPTTIRVKTGKQSVTTLASGVLNAAISEFDDDRFWEVLKVMKRTQDTEQIEEAWRKARTIRPGDGTAEIDLDVAISIANNGI